MRYLVEGGPVPCIFPEDQVETAFRTAKTFSRNTSVEVLVSKSDRHGDPKIWPCAVFQDGEIIWDLTMEEDDE